jgi:hypothetical protein
MPGIPLLVSNLNTCWLAGQPCLPPRRPSIISYVANTTISPTARPADPHTQMRDRVRAVVHLIVSSPDYIIQK